MKKFYLSAIVLGGMALGSTALVSATDSALTVSEPAPTETAAAAAEDDSEGTTDVTTFVTTTDHKVEIKEVKTFKGRNTVSIRWYSSANQTSITNDETKTETISADSYTLTRDGKVLIDHADVSSYIDSNVPDGDHTYQVIAHFGNKDLTSETKSANVSRDYGFEQYNLTEVYNYPILDEPTAEYPKGTCIDVSDEDYTSAAHIANFRVAASYWGAAGDMYRVGVYRNGHWYISQLSDKNYEDDADLKEKGIVGLTQTGSKYYDGNKTNDWGDGSIIDFDANKLLETPPTRFIKKLTQPDGEHTWDATTIHGFSNQWICADEPSDNGDFRFYFRWDGNQTQDANWIYPEKNGMFYFGNQYIRHINPWGTIGPESFVLKKQNDEWKSGFDSEWNELGAPTKKTQVARVHYATANGKTYAEEGGYLFFALNRKNKVARVKIKNDDTKNFDEEIIEIPLIEKKEEGVFDDASVTTENYAVPVVDRPEDFIYQSRSNGYYYVTKESGTWKAEPFFIGKEAECAGGITFKYNDEIFFIHPSSITSNNTGNFRIDFVDRKLTDDGQQNADDAEFTMDNMIPAASFKQKENTVETFGNSNCMWFGVEEATDDEGGIFIYQYVPGARFAKYRFRANNNFPFVTPKLDVEITKELFEDPQVKTFAAGETTKAESYKQSHNVMNVVTAKGNWQTPEKFSEVENTNWKLVGYYPVLKDEKGNVVADLVVNKDDKNAEAKTAAITKALAGGITVENGEPEKITISEDGRIAARANNKINGELIKGKFNIDFTPIVNANGLLVNEQVYTMELVPEYQKVDTDTKVLGEIGYSEDHDNYTPAIGELTATAYKDKNKAVYRVDLDFNRADMEAYPKPVDYFVIERRKINTETWEYVPDLRLMYHGHVYVTNADADFKFNGKEVPGVYRFADSNTYNEPDTYVGNNGSSDKGYANVDKKGNPIDEKVCVASHTFYGEFNPKEWEYRVTAVYASKSLPVEKGGIRKEVSVVATPEKDPTTTGADDVLAEGMTGLHVYPNPAETDITVEYGEAIESITIYTLSGAVAKDFNGNSDNRQTVNISSLAPGMYMISVNNAAPQRLIKN